MREIRIDCSGLDRAKLHAAFAEKLEFPQWYGKNLDGLFDCLTEIGTDTRLVLTGLQDEGFRLTVLDAAEENPCLEVTME